MLLTPLAECVLRCLNFFASLREIVTGLKKVYMTLGVKLTEQAMTSSTGKCLFLQNT